MVPTVYPPPAAQLLCDCGLLAEEAAKDIPPSPPTLMPHALYPPHPAYDKEFVLFQLDLLSNFHFPSALATPLH
jgi:hypothetical protein